ncbi:MAG: hypothetical protein H6945_03185 [Zoogloeaceae bacterium]|nr:hypothetical protein [Rhodocyclaceae bacterium]MCP5234726.1 hypothetical protein [Zoogloeaceae bacterium]
MNKASSKVLAFALIGMFATGAPAADRVNANNNKVVQSNSGARAEQKVRIGFMNGPLIGSARVNASGNTVIQSNTSARTKQRLDIGVFK